MTNTTISIKDQESKEQISDSLSNSENGKIELGVIGTQIKVNEPPNIQVSGSRVIFRDETGYETSIDLIDLQNIVSEKQQGKGYGDFKIGDIVQPSTGWYDWENVFGVIRHCDDFGNLQVEWTIDPTASRVGLTHHYYFDVQKADMGKFIVAAVQNKKNDDSVGSLTHEQLEFLMQDGERFRGRLIEMEENTAKEREEKEKLEKEVAYTKMKSQGLEAQLAHLLGRLEELEKVGKSEEVEELSNETAIVLKKMSKRQIIFSMLKNVSKTVGKEVLVRIVKYAIQQGVDLKWVLSLFS